MWVFWVLGLTLGHVCCAHTRALHMHACHTPPTPPPRQVFGSLGAKRRRAAAGQGAGAAPPAAGGAATAEPGVLERIGVVQALKVRAGLVRRGLLKNHRGLYIYIYNKYAKGGNRGDKACLR